MGAVEKRGEALKIPSSIEKILEIDEHMGCAMSGLTSDARTLVDHARVEAQAHWFTYNERMPVESCVNSVADLALDFSDSDEDRKRVPRACCRSSTIRICRSRRPRRLP